MLPSPILRFPIMPRRFNSFGPPNLPGMPQQPGMDPRMWQLQQMQQMQQSMGASMPGYMSRWPRFQSPLSLERTTWMSPDYHLMLQQTSGGPQMFANHRPGGPMHHVHNPMDPRIPSQYRFQYSRFARQMGGMPSRPTGYGQWQGPQAWTGWQTGYGPGRTISRSRSPYGGPRSRKNDPSSWGPEVDQMTGSEILSALQSMTVLGMPVQPEGVTGTTAMRLGIPPSRIEEHIASLHAMAQRLEQALQSRGWQNARVFSNGLCIAAQGPNGEMIVATATQLLSGGPGSRLSNGTWQSLADGSRVQWTQVRNGQQFVISGSGGQVRVVEMPDGRMLREEGSSGGAPSATLFYDGDSSRPSIVRVNGTRARVRFSAGGDGEGADLEHGSYVMGEGGPVRLQRPQSQEQAHAYLQQVALSLRTPEAIGAFVSSYMTSHDSIGRSGRRIPSLAVASFQSESGGQQYIQSAIETVMRATGDCEDFAVLASTLLQMAGISNVVARASSNHYKCVFLERTAAGYILCTIDTGGYSRSNRVFRSGAEAMASLWSGRERSGVDWEVAHPAGMDGEALAQARRVAASGGGISIIDTSSISGGGARINYVAFGEEDWDRLVYRR